MNRWSEVWSNRSVAAGAISLEELIRLDGFDHGAGKVDTRAWTRYCDELAKRLGIAPADTIFEVGCGAGALLQVFHAAGHRLGGVDLSPALLAVAAHVMPDMAFTLGEASTFAAPPHDFVIANSVFSYFPDLEYAERVLERMLATARKGVAVLDVPDLARRDTAEAYRRAVLPPGEYESRYSGLAHLYYTRDWFRSIIGMVPRGWRLRIEHQWLEGYGNAPFRFNVLAVR
ncbi:MAG: methyltransferase domain-containing protein [Nitrospiraceae bacterium]|nr:methyltransferase domain-containing protein [Nitrospiraceae bacterium]